MRRHWYVITSSALLPCSVWVAMTIYRRLLANACFLIVLSLHLCLTGSFSLIVPCGKSSSRTCRRTLLPRSQFTNNNDRSVDSFQRRGMLLSTIPSTLLLVVVFPSPCYAGEVGARINAAITKSELGIAVRESVVRGAQVMDKVDGQWEQFSDKFGLGSARSKQDKKPTPKVIPDPLPLDTGLAKRIVEITDQVCKTNWCVWLENQSLHSLFSVLRSFPCVHSKYIIDISVTDRGSARCIAPSDWYSCG